MPINPRCGGGRKIRKINTRFNYIRISEETTAMKTFAQAKTIFVSHSVDLFIIL